jgi:drug/metabolite transporter (DMT)-like permease
MPTKLLILAVSINAVLGQLLLKRGVAALGGSTALKNLVQFVIGAAQSPWIYAAVAVQGFGYLLWMMVVSRVKMGVATASAGAGFYILMALSAWFFFDEPLAPLQWVGILLITAGVIFVSLNAT